MPPYPARNMRLRAMTPKMNDQEKIWNSQKSLAIAGMNSRTIATIAVSG